MRKIPLLSTALGLLFLGSYVALFYVLKSSLHKNHAFTSIYSPMIWLTMKNDMPPGFSDITEGFIVSGNLKWGIVPANPTTDMGWFDDNPQLIRQQLGKWLLQANVMELGLAPQTSKTYKTIYSYKIVVQPVRVYLRSEVLYINGQFTKRAIIKSYDYIEP